MYSKSLPHLINSNTHLFFDHFNIFEIEICLIIINSILPSPWPGSRGDMAVIAQTWTICLLFSLLYLRCPHSFVIAIEMSSKVSLIIWHWNEVLWMQNTWKYISRAHIYINGIHFNIRQRTAVLYFLAKKLLNTLLCLRRQCISK